MYLVAQMLSASFDQAKNVCVRNRNRPGGYHSSFLVCARGFQKNLKKIQRTKKTNCPFVHCRLFHENCRFFNTFEMTVVSSSFDSDFFPGGPRTSSGSLILNLIFSPNQNRQLFENLNTRPTLV